MNLYKLDSKGKPRVWSAKINEELSEDNSIIIEILHGVLEGKLQTKTREVNQGKNIGKANETTIKEQALLEIGYLYTKQLESGYVKDLKDFEEKYRPNKAHKYKDRASKINWVPFNREINPYEYLYESKKLNGIRCFIFISKGKVIKFESREGKEFKFFHHLQKDIEELELFYKRTSLKDLDVILDGELFNPLISFEAISPLVNADDYRDVVDPESSIVYNTKDIHFHCYDFISLDHKQDSFYERFVNGFFLNEVPKESSLRLVESSPVHSEEEMVVRATSYIEDKYEGLMLRIGSSPYEFNKRTNSLLKYKIMNQDEFLIKDIYLAENDSTKIMITLYNSFGKDFNYESFDCGLKGNKEENLKYFTNKEDYIDKSWLTVDYQVLSSYGVPLFPVGVIIREGFVNETGVFTPII